ncbi:MAG: 6,7-dimethyl-8-ribityllumazine synthase [Phycisphaerales bacterium]|nr:6,7-dimethyl-8-ribityllumazine synthase [Phycisphaerales bacterium]
MHETRTSTASASDLSIAIVTARWHQSITDAMCHGAQEAFATAGGSAGNLLHICVAGAWELPVVAAQVARRDDIDGVVAIGCVIKGETSHDVWINTAVATALARISVDCAKPVSLGVLTCDSVDQAQARAGGAKGNKGSDAMQACIETIRTLQQMQCEEARS